MRRLQNRRASTTPGGHEEKDSDPNKMMSGYVTQSRASVLRHMTPHATAQDGCEKKDVKTRAEKPRNLKLLPPRKLLSKALHEHLYVDVSESVDQPVGVVIK